jgi:hypothetical protein
LGSFLLLLSGGGGTDRENLQTALYSTYPSDEWRREGYE